jgi:serine/threonine-protein kinase
MTDDSRDPLDAGLAAAFDKSPATGQTVLGTIERRTGEAPRVSLHEVEDTTGHSPVLDPGAADVRAVPRGKGNYQLMGELARGGMGVVLKGHDTDLGRDVALKVLHKDLADRPEILHRFVEEAQIGGQLQHPGIVPVYEIGLMADDRPYFTMKLVKGKTLAALLEEREDAEGGGPRRRLLESFESVCQTMAYAHSRGVIHRDLKPSNIMVGAFGEVQVVDWGLAKVIPRGGKADEQKARAQHTRVTTLETVRSKPDTGSSHSLAGSVMGTLAYMPPEQAAGHVEKLDERSDVFSLGGILCEILTGLPPYPGEHDEAFELAVNARLDDAYARLDACGADAELVALARACLTPAPAARPRNAEVVAGRLRRHLESVEERAQAALVDAAVQRRAKWLWSLVAAVIVTFVAGGLWYAQREQAAERERLAGFRGEVNAARIEAGSLLELGLYDEALTAARRGGTIAETNGLSIAEIDAVVAAIEAERDRTAAERAAAEGRRFFLTEVEAIAESPMVFFGSLPAMEEDHRRYEEAFRRLGVDLERDSVEEAAATLRRQGVTDEAVDALDRWELLVLAASLAPTRTSLMEVANAVDSNPFRVSLREALRTNDRESLAALAQAAQTRALPPGTVNLLIWGCSANELEQLTLPILQLGRASNPDDLTMNVMLGMSLVFNGEDLAGGPLVCFTAAEAIQPEAPMVRIFRAGILAAMRRDAAARMTLRAGLESATLEEVLMFHDLLKSALRNGGLDEEVATIEAFLEAQDDSLAVRLARVPFQQTRGAHGEAMATLREALRGSSGFTGFRVSLGGSLLLTGQHAQSLDEMRAALLEYPEHPTFLLDLSWSLSVCPDPALRNPEEAIELAERVSLILPDYYLMAEALGAALYRAGRLEDAVGLLELAGELRAGPRAHADYFLAMALHDLGDEDTARATLARAESWYQRFGRGRTPLWQTQLKWQREEALAHLGL